MKRHVADNSYYIVRRNVLKFKIIKELIGARADVEEYNIRFTSKNITEVGNKHLYEYFIITHITHKARKYHRNKKDTSTETIKIIDYAHLNRKEGVNDTTSRRAM
ncbi:hypothetical protein TcasGA2_TC008378 [Tribolium castaneum]|uniref:Uncharacterized protein n=1 Tax=Tribolium castaneum TaxID=7070 RepID=D2A1D9_TRICA|nr:hypothetical protein TcasGA2_TC008378 [Tribolium castaneum]